MQFWNEELDEILNAHPETPKVSLYLPEGIDLSGTRVFTGLREMAMKLLEKSRDKELLEDFRHWSLHVWSYLLDTKRAPTTAVFFSRSIRKILHLDAELPYLVVRYRKITGMSTYLTFSPSWHEVQVLRQTSLPRKLEIIRL